MGELAAAPQNIQHTIATTTASGMNLEIGYRRFRKLPFVNLYQKVNSRLCVLHPSDPPLWLSKRLRWVDGWLAGWLIGSSGSHWCRLLGIEPWDYCKSMGPEGICKLVLDKTSGRSMRNIAPVSRTMVIRWETKAAVFLLDGFLIRFDVDWNRILFITESALNRLGWVVGVCSSTHYTVHSAAPSSSSLGVQVVA